jgi:hypothetical protein
VNEIKDLLVTLNATDENAGSWAWYGDEDNDQAGAYLDCSRSQDGYCLELGDGGDAVQVDVSLSDLREIHKLLTVQLMLARQRGEM